MSIPLSSSFLVFIIIINSSYAQFTTSIKGNAVLFTASYQSSEYLWLFDDSTSSTLGPEITHYYSIGGVYSVTLVVTNTTGKSKSFTQTVIAPTNLFPVVSVSIVTSANEVSFNASTSYDPDGGIVQYSWQFNDLSPVTTTSTSVLSHAYPAVAKTYVLLLSVTDNSGAVSTIKEIVKIVPPPVARFYYLPIGNSVHFDSSLSSSSGSQIKTYIWNFGLMDENFTTIDTLITYYYPSMRLWLVTLTVIDNNNVHSAPFQMYIFSPFNLPPVAFLEAKVTPNTDQVYLSPVGSGDVDGFLVKYIFEFGDFESYVVNTTSTDNLITIEHTYKLGGNYRLNLTVFDNSGASSSFTLEVFVNIRPIAYFSTTMNYNSLDSVLVNASGSLDYDGSVISTVWSFYNNSSFVKSSSLSTQYNYPVAGYYNISLQVVDNLGAYSLPYIINFLVNDPPIPKINIQKIINDTVVVDAFQSQDKDGNIVQVEWLFDSTASSNQSVLFDNTSWKVSPVSHTYLKSGFYNISLIATDNLNTTNRTSIQVFVNTPPTAQISIIKVVNDTIILSASGSSDGDGFISLYEWNAHENGSYPFLSSNSATLFNYTYKLGGYYNVTLTVIDNWNYTGNTYLQIFVNTLPIAYFDIEKNVDDIVILNASLSTDYDGFIQYYLWYYDLENFENSTSLNPYSSSSSSSSSVIENHKFAACGWYNVSLIVVDNLNGSNNYTRPIFVNIPPVAHFEVIFNENDTVILSPIGSNDNDSAIISYQWDFETPFRYSGTKILMTYNYSTNVTFHYVKSGYYNVTLHVTDNCKSTTNITKTILVDIPPKADFVVLDVKEDLVIVSAESYINTLTQGFNNTLDPAGGYIDALIWNFGAIPNINITNYTYSTQTYQYNTCGEYTISLYALDNMGEISKIHQEDVFVNIIPEAHFNIIQQSLGPFLTEFSFNATYSKDFDGRVIQYCWLPGDKDNIETCLDTPILTYSFLQGSSYNVTFYAIDNCKGKSLPLSVLLYVPNFQLYLYSKVLNNYLMLEVHIDDPQHINLIKELIVRYGDNLNSSLTNGSQVDIHRYNLCGTYNITVDVLDVKGNYISSLVSEDNIFINSLPQADFIFYMTSTDNPLTWTFDASSSADEDGGISNFCWKFNGDNDTIICTSEPVIQHYYTKVGSYNVSLIVQDICGNFSNNYMMQIVNSMANNVLCGENSLEVDFIIYDRSSESGWMTFLTNSSYTYDKDNTSYIISYSWVMGDNSSTLIYNDELSNQSMITHTYNTTNNYTVSLSVLDNLGRTKFVAYDVFVIVDPQSTPDELDIYSIRFGITNNQSSTVKSSSMQSTYLAKPIFTYWFLPNQTILNLNVESNTPLGVYTWSMGDESLINITTTKTKLTYDYRIGGLYNVTLTITDVFGINASSWQLISIPFKPVPVFTATPLDDVLSKTIILNASMSYSFASNNELVCVWYISEDDAILDSCITNFTFSVPGYYGIILQVTDLNGYMANITRGILVGMYDQSKYKIKLTQNPFSDSLYVINKLSGLYLTTDNAPTFISNIPAALHITPSFALGSLQGNYFANSMLGLTIQPLMFNFEIYKSQNSYLIFDPKLRGYITFNDGVVVSSKTPIPGSYWIIVPVLQKMK